MQLGRLDRLAPRRKLLLYPAVPRIGGKPPQQDIDAQDHGAGAAEKQSRAVPHVAQHHAQHRTLVRRQLHDEQGRFAFEQGLLEQPCHQQRHHNAQQIHRQHREAGQPDEAEHALVGDARGDEQGINRQPRRTTHQRRDQDGYQPVLRGFNRACRHDARNRAGKRAEHRYETLPVQANLAHQAVHQERRARHVAGVLQKTDEQKQQQDLRQENNHRAHTGNHAIHQQTVEIPRRDQAPNESAQAGHCRLEGVHGNPGEAENALKHHRHDADEHQHAPHPMRHDTIQPVAECILGPGYFCRHVAMDPRHSSVTRLDGGAAPIESGAFQPQTRLGHGLAQCRRIAFRARRQGILVTQHQECLGPAIGRAGRAGFGPRSGE